jgi:hypothetical protein
MLAAMGLISKDQAFLYRIRRYIRLTCGRCGTCHELHHSVRTINSCVLGTCDAKVEHPVNCVAEPDV